MRVRFAQPSSMTPGRPWNGRRLLADAIIVKVEFVSACCLEILNVHLVPSRYSWRVTHTDDRGCDARGDRFEGVDVRQPVL